jgi:peptide deformylase
MSKIKILQYPDPQLKRKALHVEDVKAPHIQGIIDDMLETLYDTPNCAGLAATQLALPNPPRISVICLPQELKSQIKGKFVSKLGKLEVLCLINPEITKAIGSCSDFEGCKSVYPDDLSAKVTRATNITATTLDRQGNILELEAEDFMARCIQHELDHLDGIIFLDRLSKFKRAWIEKKMSKLK